MSMETNLAGRLRNTSLPASSGLLPLYEAVANSIHGIEDAGLDPSVGKITVEIVRDSQGALAFAGDQKKRGPEAKNDISGFRVIDNGIGFNAENMTSFQTLDSDYKASRGGRGVGRLMWLKAFERVRIVSSYINETQKVNTRTFQFSSPNGVSGEEMQHDSLKEVTTSVFLEGFEKRYREASHRTAIAIATDLLEHCLWYFVREGGAPQIEVIDAEEDGPILLDALYDDYMVSSAEIDLVEIKGEKFELTHIKRRTHTSRPHAVAFCASGRVVKDESLRGKIPGLFGALSDESGPFVYGCFVTSPFLDRRVRSERIAFDIEDEQTALFEGSELSFKDIREIIYEKAQGHLESFLDENMKNAHERIEKFVSEVAPRYRPIINRIPETDRNIDPNISDKDLDLALHKHLYEMERTILADGHSLMSPSPDQDVNVYAEKLREYLERVEDIKKSDLANYVSHRKVVIDLLEKAIERKADGKYAREDVIHQLIMPMQKDSNDLMTAEASLWLVDERLAFHNYLASDKTLRSMPITGATETKEPDLCRLEVYDNPLFVSDSVNSPFASLTVIEIKRPMRNDAGSGDEKDPIEQALNYLQRIRDGKVTMANGRPILGGTSIPGYCYVLCDLTETMRKRCLMHDLMITSDGLGYFGYKKSFSSYVEVISFDQLVTGAKQRNRAFFDKLGLPAK